MTEPTTEFLAPVGQDPTDPNHYYMRYPTLSELLYRGGREGIEYCLVAGYNQRKFMDQHGFDNLKEPPDAERKLVFSIEGPKGIMDTVVLMGKCAPIPGSDDFNGVRDYGVDEDIIELTGLTDGVVYDDEDKPSEEPTSASTQGKKPEGDKQ